MTRLDRELRRGTLEMVLLHLLAKRARYGYELITHIQERTDGAIALKEGTLYPVLYRLEDQGLVEPTWDAPARGVPRKYYRVTAAGREALEVLRSEWRRFTSAIERLLQNDEDQDTRDQTEEER